MVDGACLNFGFWVDSAFFVDIVYQKHRWIGAHNAIVSNCSTVRAIVTSQVYSLLPTVQVAYSLPMNDLISGLNTAPAYKDCSDVTGRTCTT